MVFGLLCAADGCPVAVEVFPGNTADPTTLAAQVRKIRDRFGVRRVALVGDRGMITSARIRTESVTGGLDCDLGPAHGRPPQTAEGPQG